MLGTSENHFGPSLNYMVDDLHERYAQMVFTSWMAFIIVVVVAAAMEGKAKVIKRLISPITGLRYPEGSRKLRFPGNVTVAQVGGKVVSLMHRPLFTPRKYPWYSFLLETVNPRAVVCLEGLCQ